MKFSDWAATLIPVPKADGSVRLCGDCKVIINPVLQVDQYLMPTWEYHHCNDVMHAHTQITKSLCEMIRSIMEATTFIFTSVLQKRE